MNFYLTHWIKLTFEIIGTCFCICKENDIELFEKAEGQGSCFLFKNNKTIKRNKYSASVRTQNADLCHGVGSPVTPPI